MPSSDPSTHSAMVRHSPVGLCLVDGGDRVVEANASWCRLAGVSEDAIAGAPWLEVFHPVDRPPIAARLARVRAGEAAREEATCRLREPADGPWVRLECELADAGTGAVVVTAADITALRDVEEEVAAAFSRALEAENLLEEAIDAMSEGFIYFDADDRVVCANAKHRELFPSHADAVRPGMSFEDLLRAQVRNIRLEAAVGREEEWIADRVAQHRNPSGPIEQTWADGRIIRLSEYRTRSGGIVSIRTDITDLKRAEAEVRELNEVLEARVAERTAALEAAQDELVRRERLAALGQVIASVSHDLRSPLATIATSLRVLREEAGEASPLTRRAADRIERATARCNAIVSDLLDFSRPVALDVEDTGVDDWLAGVLDDLPDAPGVELVRRLDAGGARVDIDRERMRRVLVNLHENACQALAGAGTVAVETRPRDGAVAVSVSDDGPGIAPDQREVVLEPMFTTKANGIGLGLAIVKRIVEQHGAALEVSGAPLGGACFTIVLAARPR